MYVLLLGSFKEIFLSRGRTFPAWISSSFYPEYVFFKNVSSFLLISWFFSQVSEEVFESFRSLARKQQEFQDQKGG
jgi:hypothetical protein